MHLTRAFEQATCIIVLLATQDPEHTISSEVIHHRLGGSQTYLRKIIRKLVVAGLVKSASGNSGGFTLARPADEVSIYDVVLATEGQIKSYPDTGKLDTVFNDFQPVAKQGTLIINAAFHKADMLWANELKRQIVSGLIIETIGHQAIPVIDWNQSAEQRELLIQKIIKNLK